MLFAVSNNEQLACKGGHKEFICCSVASDNLMPLVNVLHATILLILLRTAKSCVSRQLARYQGTVVTDKPNVVLPDGKAVDQ